MALTDEQIDILSSQYVTGLYSDMEQEVINDIVRRVNKTGRLTETAEIMARNMREQGFSTGRILSEVRAQLNSDPAYIAEVAENTKEYKEMVRELIAETEAKALAEGDMLMAAAGDMAFNYDMKMWSAHDVNLKADNTLSQLKEAFTRQTADSLSNLTRTTGALQIGGIPILDEYQHEMDLAVIKMCSGGFSYGQAVKDCAHRLAHYGLAVEYPSGRKYNIDAAARMCVRTASSQLAGRISEQNMKKTAQALVYVSAHAGARPEHAVWQGQVYVYDRSKADKYPQYEDFYRATDYGSVTGLKGVNCSHNFYPYWEGDPIPEFNEPDPVQINGNEYSYYEATQEQRKMERGIRQTKRELEATRAIGGDQQDIDKLTKQLSTQVQEYNRFSYAANIRPKTERMAVPPGTTNLDATKAINNFVKNYSAQGYKDLGFKEKTVDCGASYDAKIANIKRYLSSDPEKDGYNSNCVKSVAAYVARRNNLDVTALPSPKKDGDFIAQHPFTVFEKSIERVHYLGTSGSYEKIVKQVEKYPEGGIAEIFMKIEQNGVTNGHAFVAEKIDGKVIFTDPQNTEYNAIRLFKYEVPGHTVMLRVDDLEPTEHAKKCYEDM